MTRGLRQRKKPTRAELEQENLDLRDALEQIADILEEVGIIDPGEDDDEGDLAAQGQCTICGADAVTYFPESNEAFCEQHYPEDNLIPGEAKVVNKEPKE